jgi:hypothetical protein
MPKRQLIDSFSLCVWGNHNANPRLHRKDRRTQPRNLPFHRISAPPEAQHYQSYQPPLPHLQFVIQTVQPQIREWDSLHRCWLHHWHGGSTLLTPSHVWSELAREYEYQPLFRSNIQKYSIDNISVHRPIQNFQVDLPSLILPRPGPLSAESAPQDDRGWAALQLSDRPHLERPLHPALLPIQLSQELRPHFWRLVLLLQFRSRPECVLPFLWPGITHKRFPLEQSVLSWNPVLLWNFFSSL